MCHKKKTIKFENYKNCFEAIQLENKIKLTQIDKVKSTLKTQQRFKSERHNIFTEEINKIALSSNDHKRMQSIDSIETYAYRTSKLLVREKEEIKCSNIIKQYKK